MSYTTNRQPQGMMKDPGSILREGMIAELVAIDDYAKFIGETENKEVKNIFHHIMEEEKHHYALFLNALKAVDEEECRIAEKAEAKIQLSSRDKYRDGSKGRDYKDRLLTDIRLAIKGELEAIILYEEFICSLSDESLKEVVHHIKSEEKEHVEELIYALFILDRDKYYIEHDDKTEKE